MSDARWIEVEDDFSDAAAHFAKACDLYGEGGFDDEGLKGYRATMALMHAMQSAHTSLESGLVRILEMLGEEKPVGRDWHADLLRRVSRQTGDRPAILSIDTARLADETRRFRNVAMRNYNNFRPEEASRAVAAARLLASRLLHEFRTFRQIVDPDLPLEEPPQP